MHWCQRPFVRWNVIHIPAEKHLRCWYAKLFSLTNWFETQRSDIDRKSSLLTHQGDTWFLNHDLFQNVSSGIPNVTSHALQCFREFVSKWSFSLQVGVARLQLREHIWHLRWKVEIGCKVSCHFKSLCPERILICHTNLCKFASFFCLSKKAKTHCSDFAFPQTGTDKWEGPTLRVLSWSTFLITTEKVTRCHSESFLSTPNSCVFLSNCT